MRVQAILSILALFAAGAVSLPVAGVDSVAGQVGQDATVGQVGQSKRGKACRAPVDMFWLLMKVYIVVDSVAGQVGQDATVGQVGQSKRSIICQ